MGASIEFRDVTVTRRRPTGERLVVLDDVSFALPAGCRAAVIGPSGAGKSTLLRLINRLSDPDRGQILIGGVDVRDIPPPALRRRVGMVFQQPRLFDATVRENLDRPLVLAGRPPLDQRAAEAALARVDLPASLLDSHGRDLSVGQQQRVALARALVLEPDVLLLDEPTSALDPSAARIILDLLVRLSDTTGVSIVMVSHAIDQAERIAREVLAVQGGQVRQFASAREAAAWALQRLEYDVARS